MCVIGTQLDQIFAVFVIAMADGADEADKEEAIAEILGQGESRYEYADGSVLVVTRHAC